VNGDCLVVSVSASGCLVQRIAFLCKTDLLQGVKILKYMPSANSSSLNTKSVSGC
jgi:hypothetical protein